MPSAQVVTVAQVVRELGLSVRAEGRMEAPVLGAQASDLLSYVMASGKHGQVWITVQTHPNIVAVAALPGMSAIIVAGGFEPEDDTVARAEDEQIALLCSAETTYTLAGKLYALGVR